ncbi:triosephosphate isomerase [Exophiala aquamarina CBS 119918]|uniref:Triosephosphate isomerase n=1 Tax=Exophiala aquamarina CBS 119918 TaxID=1182545 RepID=A0A072PGN5_9EURO|nr:triosephosphate isomerase [Exophiala aquamarina CBS 119918]KEF59026.1 triosephosphate isomerase [Exophiala aquamarina CBS 119918]
MSLSPPAISGKKYPSLPSKIILTSTKAYFSPARTIQYLESILAPATDILPLLESHRAEMLFVLIPDFLTIYPCARILSERYAAVQQEEGATSSSSSSSSSSSAWPLLLGAQNAFWSASYGAYTGEIVPSALSSLGCSIVELNHAERRRLLAETDETAALKAAAVTDAGMVPLVCVGEIEKPDLARGTPLSMAVGQAMRQLAPQIESVLRAVPPDAPVILAYEPVWAIGAAEPAGVEYVGPVVQAIRQVAAGVVRARTAPVKVVYGGSAGPGLWSGTANGGNGLGQYVDGLFLGRFAHQVDGVKAVLGEVVQSLAKS